MTTENTATFMGLIGDPATLSAFLLHLLDDLQYTPWDVIYALSKPWKYEEEFSRWLESRVLTPGGEI